MSTHLGFGGQNMVGRLRRVLVCPPPAGFGAADPRRWHYGRRPDGARAATEHEVLVSRLVDAGVEVVTLDAPPHDACDAVFTHDPSLVTDRGVLLLRMSKALRRPEAGPTRTTFERLGIPLLDRLSAPATAEGGDLLWLDRATLVVGRGHRTDELGLQALRRALTPAGVEVVPVDLPVPHDRAQCLHLMSVMSLVDTDLAVVYPPLLTESLRALLDSRGIDRIAVPDEEYPGMGANVLALAPRDCLAVAGNPVTRRRLEAAGCRVQTFPGAEIAVNTEGGPTCLTRPLLRDPVS